MLKLLGGLLASPAAIFPTALPEGEKRKRGRRSWSLPFFVCGLLFRLLSRSPLRHASEQTQSILPPPFSILPRQHARRLAEWKKDFPSLVHSHFYGKSGAAAISSVSSSSSVSPMSRPFRCRRCCCFSAQPAPIKIQVAPLSPLFFS